MSLRKRVPALLSRGPRQLPLGRKHLLDLDERSREIITRRWLAEDQEETLQMLADKYGVSAERIRQIEVKAMKQMRKEIENLRSRTRKGQALRGLFL